MKEPPGVGHTWTAEPDVCGDCVGEEDLECLLDRRDPSDDAVGGVEDADAETEAEGDQGDQEGGQLAGQQPAGGGQAQRLALIIHGVKVKICLQKWAHITEQPYYGALGALGALLKK